MATIGWGYTSTNGVLFRHNGGQFGTSKCMYDPRPTSATQLRLVVLLYLADRSTSPPNTYTHVQSWAWRT